MPSITLHHLESSRGHRIVFLLEELGLPYELKVYPRGPMGPGGPPPPNPDLVAVHPLGRSPTVTIVEDDGTNIVLGESGAIVEYLTIEHGKGKLIPTNKVNKALKAKMLFWVHFVEGSLSPASMGRMMARDNPERQAFAVAQHNRLLGYIESELAASGGPYLLGPDFTIADVMLAQSIAGPYKMHKEDLAPYPKIIGWFETIKERPAYIKASEKCPSKMMGPPPK